jgi:hypothetical protein
VEAAEGAEAKEVGGAGGRFTAKVEVKAEAEVEGILEEVGVGLR